MAFALSTTSNNTSMALQFLPSSSHAEPLLNTLHMPRQHNHHRNLSRSTIALARNRNRNSPISISKKKKKIGAKKAVVEEDDPFEALFSQLEEDLKNDDASNDDDEDINDEDFELLARELEEVLGADGLDIFDDDDDDDDDVAEADDDDDDDDVAAADDDDEDEEEEEEEEEPLKLKNWQLKRLARALKVGRRKTSIKNLAGELNLDRAIVLSLLRDPPPSLVMLSATLPDEPGAVAASMPETKTKLEETIIDETEEDTPEPNKTKVKEPVHMMQEKWSAQKRLKKVQVETMERVYRRSKRPTNTMVSSIVHVTNLPRQRVLKWFEDRRAEEGVTESEHRGAYRRSVSESVFT